MEKLFTQKNVKHEQEMPSTKIDGFFLECPWAAGIVTREDVEQVYVKRANSYLLIYKPQFINRLLDLSYEETIYLLDKDGKVINFYEPIFKRKILSKEKILANYKVRKGKVSGKTLQSLIKKIPQPDLSEVRYIFSYYGYTKTIILYKIPDNTPLLSWLELETKKEKDLFQKELKAIE